MGSSMFPEAFICDRTQWWMTLPPMKQAHLQLLKLAINPCKNVGDTVCIFLVDISVSSSVCELANAAMLTQPPFLSFLNL